MQDRRADHIKRLRERLLEARQKRDRGMLAEVEDGLRQLTAQGYRCCLLDYERGEPCYYVRLTGYEAGRVQAELEFPIAADVAPVQQLPLSHLADYSEVESGVPVEGIYRTVEPFIHNKRPALKRGPVPGLLTTPEGRPRMSSPARSFAERRVLWYVGGACLLVALAHLVARIASQPLL